MRYIVSGYDEYAVLHLLPVDGDNGAEIPAALYGRWTSARAELDTVRREVLAHLRKSGGRAAIPEELWEPGDRADGGGIPGAGWDSW